MLVSSWNAFHYTLCMFSDDWSVLGCQSYSRLASGLPYFIPAGEHVQSFAGLWCSMFPWAQGFLAKDLTCAVQGVHLMVTETGVHWSEFTLLVSAQFLRRQQWHQVWDSSMNCAHTDGVVELASWGSAPGSVPASEHVTCKQRCRTDSKGDCIWEWLVWMVLQSTRGHSPPLVFQGVMVSMLFMCGRGVCKTILQNFPGCSFWLNDLQCYLDWS